MIIIYLLILPFFLIAFFTNISENTFVFIMNTLVLLISLFISPLVIYFDIILYHNLKQTRKVKFEK